MLCIQHMPETSFWVAIYTTARGLQIQAAKAKESLLHTGRLQHTGAGGPLMACFSWLVAAAHAARRGNPGFFLPAATSSM